MCFRALGRRALGHRGKATRAPKVRTLLASGAVQSRAKLLHPAGSGVGVCIENPEDKVLCTIVPFTIQVKGIIGEGAEAPSCSMILVEGAIRAALAEWIACAALEAPTALRGVSRGVSGTPRGGHFGPFGSPREAILLPLEASGSRPGTSADPAGSGVGVRI